MNPKSRLFALFLIMIVLIACLGKTNLPELHEMSTLTPPIEPRVTQTSKPTVIPPLTSSTRVVVPIATKDEIRPLITPTSGHLQPPEANNQMITFWYQLSPHLESLLAKFIERFNDSNVEGITIAGEKISVESDIYAEFLQAKREGNQPHLLMSSQYVAPRGGDAFTDFVFYFEDQRFGLSEKEQNDLFLFSDHDFHTQHQPLFLFPGSYSLEVIYYNVDLLQQLGFDAPPMTWEALQEMACAARDAGYIGYQFKPEEHHLMGMILSRGESFITGDADAYHLDSPAAIDSMSFLQQLFAQGCAHLATEMQIEAFGLGQLLFAVDSTAELASYQSAAAFGYGGSWAVTAFPHSTTEPLLISDGPAFSIPKSTTQQQLGAWLFVKWYSDSQQQAEWAQLSSYFPVRQSATLLLSTHFAQNPSYKEAFDLLKYSKSEANITLDHQVHGLLTEVMIEILNGADVEQTMKDLNEEANAILQQDQP